MLIHLIDLDPATGRDPVDDLRVINDELRAYSAALAERPQIVVLNKADLLGAVPDVDARRERLEQHCAAAGMPLSVISAATGAGLTELLHGVTTHLERAGWLRVAS